MPISSIGAGDLCKVWEIKTLGLGRDADARKLLDDVAKQVQPIMRKRKWKVQLLSEFCPNNPSLLGLNIDGGREIRIRLRRHVNDPQLFAYEETLGTMLHELTHIECGPHDTAFYKLLDELKKECEELMIKGIKGTGQGFDARGQRLGGFRHNPPPANVREVALAAAEKRARLGVTMPKGPRCPGGDLKIMNDLSPVQAAAMAAERRLMDDIWCAAPVTVGEDRLNKSREESSGSQVENVQKSDEPAKENQGWRQNSQTSSVTISDTTGKMTSLARATDVIPTTNLIGKQRNGRSGTLGEGSNTIRISDVSESTTRREDSTWECHICTLLNTSFSTACAACTTPRMQAIQDNSRFWMCKFCTLKNDEQLANCGACDQWRFSYGAPISTHGPYVGT